jgi:hypothetical protein
VERRPAVLSQQVVTNPAGKSREKSFSIEYLTRRPARGSHAAQKSRKKSFRVKNPLV